SAIALLVNKNPAPIKERDVTRGTTLANKRIRYRFRSAAPTTFAPPLGRSNRPPRAHSPLGHDIECPTRRILTAVAVDHSVALLGGEFAIRVAAGFHLTRLSGTPCGPLL